MGLIFNKGPVKLPSGLWLCDREVLAVDSPSTLKEETYSTQSEISSAVISGFLASNSNTGVSALRSKMRD